MQVVAKTKIACVKNLWLGGIYTYNVYNIIIVDKKLPPEEATVA